MKHMSLCATRFVCSTTLHRALLLAIAMVLLLPAAPAQADIGPKPGMAFAFEYQIPKTSIVSAQMLECQDAECKTSTPLQQMGPHGLRCNEYDCRSAFDSWRCRWRWDWRSCSPSPLRPALCMPSPTGACLSATRRR
jgi:hypothetical protein